MIALGRTKLDVFPICLSGNVFGWTADEPQSRAVAAVALAWLLAQPRVVAPIASAGTTEQLDQILPGKLELTPADVDRLSATTRAA
jgi:aryl-alcohol dehydrogenase-like predicted oxidoreductase